MSDVTISTPALDKLHSVHEKSQVVGEFLDWLINERGVTLAEPGRWNTLQPIGQSFRTLLAEFFEVDEAECERERLAILDALREGHERRGEASRGEGL